MRISRLLVVVTCCCMVAGGASAKKGVRFGFLKKKTEVAVDTLTKKSTYEKFFKGKHETVRGLFVLHKMNGKLYFEMPLSLMGKEMLIGSTITQTSDNGDGIVGSKPFDPLHISFTKNGNNIQMRRISCDYVTDNAGSNIAKAIKDNSIGAVIKNMKIETYTTDSTGVVFDMTDFFVGNNPEMSPFDSFSYYSLMGLVRKESFESGRSYLDGIKAFEDNVMIRSVLSYTYDLEYARTQRTLASKKPFTAVMSRSIVLLKDQPVRPRIADHRVAVFPTQKTLYGEEEQGARYVYYANKWNLEPVDMEAYKRGELVEPIKPIVFYVDNNFPDKLKPHIMEGVTQWNEMFKKAGFKNAIQAKEFPMDDPEFDPDNIKYSCIRYAPVGIANAMGPSWVDPRSGEIINASVYIYHDIMQLLNNWMFVQTSQADPRVRAKLLPESVLNDGFRYVVAHEVGHCLGYMHNMSASSLIPVDSLRSPSFTQKYGTTTSIMDYARFNYVAQPGDYERGVKLTPPRFGQYDQFAIEWSYKVHPEAKTAEEESEIVSKWVTEMSADPIYRWGVQLGSALDPRSQAEDLGDNSIKATEYGVKNLKYILANYDKWVADQDDDFTYRTQIYDAIIMQMFQYFLHVNANVGGIHLNQIKATDPVLPYRSVSTKQQRDAMLYAMSLLKDLEWIDNKALMQKIGMIGSPRTVLQSIFARFIITNPLKVRLSSLLSEEQTAYDFYACSDDLFDFIWNPAIKGVDPSETEKMLQKNMISMYAEVSKIKGMVGSLSVSFTDQLQALISPEMILADLDVDDRYREMFSKQYGANTILARGYAGYSTRYAIVSNEEYMYYDYFMKMKRLIETMDKSRLSRESRMHYDLMLRNIKSILKVE